MNVAYSKPAQLNVTLATISCRKKKRRIETYYDALCSFCRHEFSNWTGYLIGTDTDIVSIKYQVLIHYEKQTIPWLDFTWYPLENAFQNRVMKGRHKKGYKWQEDEEEEVSNYWMTLRKWQDIGNYKWKHHFVFCDTKLWKTLWTWSKTDCWMIMTSLATEYGNFVRFQS